jgi:hypothetical protein
MKHLTFMVYNLVGGLPEDKIDYCLLRIILCIIVLSLFPSVWHLIKDKKSKLD